jgi:hypothetical protein
MNHRQVDRAFHVEAEAPPNSRARSPGQMPARNRLAAGLPPEVAEHQVGADTAATDLRQFAAVEVLRIIRRFLQAGLMRNGV